MPERPSTLVICCGAVAREVVALIRNNGWEHMAVTCLPAKLHNDPDAIPEKVRAKIHKGRQTHDKILVLYSDCGTGGRLTAVIEEEGVEGIGGAHCYEIFTGTEDFYKLMADEPGCFFVTDFLARHFERLVFRGLGLHNFPQLRDTYFGRYKKLVYLAQSDDDELLSCAQTAATSIGLDLEVRKTGFGEYETFLASH